jgi:hypothetical protein
MRPEIEKMAARAVLAVIAGRGLHSAEVRELLHLLHLIKDTAKEAAENLRPEEEPRGHRRWPMSCWPAARAWSRPRSLRRGFLRCSTPERQTNRAHEHLQGFRSILERDLAPAVGANTAAQMVEVFVAAVMNEKRRLEAAAGPNAPMVSQWTITSNSAVNAAARSEWTTSSTW